MKFFAPLFFFSILFLTGCFDVVFESPQPKSFKNLEHFPETILGQYTGFSLNNKKTRNNDSIRLKIESEQVIWSEVKWEKVPLSNKEKINKLKAYKPFTENKPTKKETTYSYYEKGDTFYFCKMKKEYYRIGKEFFLRSMANNYFLNISDTIDENEKRITTWDVFMFSFQENGTFIFKMPSFSQQPDPAGAHHRDSVITREVESSEIFTDSLSKKNYLEMQLALDSFMTVEEAKKYYSTVIPFKQWSQHESGGTVFSANPDSTQLKALIKKGLFIDICGFKKEK